MSIVVFNTLSGKKEPFVELNAGRVTMYTCGPTVYDFFHIGNARCFVIHDVIRRYFRYCGYDVTYVQNFTDIDDKMIKRAAEKGISVSELAERFITAYFEDADALGIERADIHPRATEHIPEMISLVERLIANGHAYEVDGDVYYSVSSFADYGKLSHQRLEDLQAGSRVDVDERKQHPFDFALWKKQKPGEPAWDSPWGMGRPGWHLECSAMSMKYLGETFDIHAGGADLVFPHHENEIAQSEGATKKPFARYWLHNAYLNIEGAKMSKSLGNFLLVRELRERFDPIAVRMFLISAHYRNPLNFTVEQIESAEAALRRLRTTLTNLEHLLQNRKETCAQAENSELERSLPRVRAEFEKAMDDDFNTADALGVLFSFAREINSIDGDSVPVRDLVAARDLLLELGGLLGVLGEKTPGAKDHDQETTDALLGLLLKIRERARKNRDWALADLIRDELQQIGFVIEDTSQGPRWKMST